MEGPELSVSEREVLRGMAKEEREALEDRLIVKINMRPNVRVVRFLKLYHPEILKEYQHFIHNIIDDILQESSKEG